MPPDHTGTGSWSGRRRAFPKRTARRIIATAEGCALDLPGCDGTPVHADHIVGHADALALGWDPAYIDDPANGQAVCASCHAIKTRAEQARGRARAANARPKARPKPKHPGLTT